MTDQGVYPLRQVAVRLKMSECPPIYGDRPMDNPDSAVEVLAKMLSEMDREYICVVNLDTRLVPLNFNIVSIGGIDTCQVPVANVFKAAILTNASRVICFHNHPSGAVNPSWEDIAMTKRLVEVGKLMEIPLVDHIIIGGGTGEKYSLKENMSDLFDGNERKSVLGELKDRRENLCGGVMRSGTAGERHLNEMSL